MASEKMVDKVLRLSGTPSNIRNICTSAHIHHGKCIAPDSRIILPDGNIKNAKQIFEEIASSGKIFKETTEYTIYESAENFEMFSLNKETGAIEKKLVKHFWRLNGGKTINISLRNNFRIETTPEHKYIVYRDSNFEEIEAKNIRLGDRIVCARKLASESSLSIKSEILKRLAKSNFYVKLNGTNALQIKNRILDYGIDKLASEAEIKIKQKSFYHGVWQGRYNLYELVNTANILGFSLEDLYGQIDCIYYRTGKRNGQNSLQMKLPENFEEFFYLAGLLIGDGSGKKFIAGKPELGQRFIEICNSLGITTKYTKWKDKTPEIHSSLTLARVINSLFDYPLKKKSLNVSISEFALLSDDKFLAMLLRGYFDTDGGVEHSRSAVTISSASAKMINDLHLALLRFGCIAIKEVDNTISLSGNSVLNFEKNIGFGLAEKSEKLAVLTGKSSGSIVCDTVNVGNRVMLVKKLIHQKSSDELAFIEVKTIEQGYQEIVYDFTVPGNHNFIAEGMVIHNTAFTDNLLAASGHMSEKSAGDLDAGMATWQHKDEQERLLTVDSANVSMIHTFQDQEYLINLIDTPGHIDFGGNVTRAMRAVDGTIVLVCASEGIMPQTETVLKQAIRERVKPVLFINKVDRLIKELKLTPEGIQKKFIEIIKRFNELVEDLAEPQFREKWKVDIVDGSVAFGSARDNWALSYSFMQKKNVKFSDIEKIYSMPEEDRKQWVWDHAPLHEVILDMVIKHLPNPLEAQTYRIPKIWKGDPESEFGKDLITCNKNGRLGFVITRIVIDPRSGKEMSAGRLFSGTVKPGMEVYLNLAKQKQRIQQVYIYNGIKPEMIEEVPAGNVLALGGLMGTAGETITLDVEQPFEELKHIFEPVITKAVEPVKPQDLPKVVEVLRKVSKEDPSIKIHINEETGENLMSGMGELHLEIVENRIKTEKGVEIRTSPPIVVYRESIMKVSQEVEGKSPNKHNKFYFIVEPMPESLREAIQEAKIPSGRVKKKNLEFRQILMDAGMDLKEADQVKDVFNGSMFLDLTKGQVHMIEVLEMILDMFEDVMENGPLAREPCINVMVKLTDMKLHEDAIHRGPAQVYPAIREGIRGAMMTANPVMYEPIQTHLIEGPTEYMGEITKLVSSKRGQLLDMKDEGMQTVITARLPVMEMLGWASDLRSATGGRGVSSLSDQKFERLPVELQEKVVKQIKDRKGLSDSQVGV